MFDFARTEICQDRVNKKWLQSRIYLSSVRLHEKQVFS